MKIAIVGAGWVGCHLASVLRHTHDVTLFAPTGEVFDGTSMHNQNRLHLGYHYARSHRTRELCKDTFQEFLHAYGHLTQPIHNNLYAVPVNESLMDFATYLKIFDDMHHQVVNEPTLENIEGCIQVDERYIDPAASKNYFQQQLKSLIVDASMSSKDLQHAADTHDAVVNCTNNFLQPDTNNTFWEQCVMLVYSKKQPCNFGALTLVDGPLFSIYPYLNDNITLSHVLHTPVYKSSTPSATFSVDVDQQRRLMEQDVLKYFPNFHDYFAHQGHFTSTKIKRNIKCDDRSPVMRVDNNIISCYTGKIQGIFHIQKFVEHELSHWK